MTDSSAPAGRPLQSPLARYGAIGLGALILIGAIGGGITYFNIQSKIDPSIPAAPTVKAKDVADAQRQDLEYLKNLGKLDRSFTVETLKDFNDKIDMALKDVGNMSPVRFELEVAGIVATAANVETEVVGPARRRRLARLPIRMAPFADGLYVTKATAAFGDLLGARVTGINGIPLDDAISRFDPYHSGPDWARRYAARDLWHAPEALQAVGLSQQSDAVVLKFLLRSGKEEFRRLNALPGILDGQADYLPWMDLVPGINPGREDENWVELLANPDRVPVTESAITDAVSFARLEKPNAVLVTISPSDLSDKDLAARLDAVLVGLREMTPHHLILNLRRVGTGSANPYAAFIQALPAALPNGAVFIVTSSSTGSLGVELIARIQSVMADRTMVLGLPPAQARRFWASNGHKITLPNSGIVISFATVLRDFDKGCSDWSACGFGSGSGSIAQGPFAQDVTFVPRFDNYAEGKDTTLEVIKALMGQPD